MLLKFQLTLDESKALVERFGRKTVDLVAGVSEVLNIGLGLSNTAEQENFVKLILHTCEEGLTFSVRVEPSEKTMCMLIESAVEERRPVNLHASVAVRRGLDLPFP